jgi:hypothetical protein
VSTRQRGWLRNYVTSREVAGSCFFLLLLVEWDFLGTAATTGLLYQPQMIGDGDCGEIGGMKVDRG